jgi:uncharacterized protein YbjT (DUF2867 family)
MILLTGAAGQVGREVVSALVHRGARVRAADLDPGRIPAGGHAAVECVSLDLRAPASFEPAVRGCSGRFLLRPPAISDTRATLGVLLARARAAGVPAITFPSAAGAGRNRLVPHHAVERDLQTGPLDWTILRPGFFAQNFASAYLRDVREDDRVHVPAGGARVALVDVGDVGEVAASALLEPVPHRGRAYTLTGGEAVTFARAAELLSATLGRPIRYEPASVLGYARHLLRRGLPPAQILFQTILHVGLRHGQAARVDPTLATLLGRPPRTLASYLADHASVFQPLEEVS